MVVWNTFEVINIPSIEYRLQAKRHAEDYNATLITGPPDYLPEHQTDFETHLLPVTYYYSIYCYRTIKESTLSLAPARSLPKMATLVRIRADLVTENDMDSPMCYLLELIKRPT